MLYFDNKVGFKLMFEFKKHGSTTMDPYFKVGWVLKWLLFND